MLPCPWCKRGEFGGVVERKEHIEGCEKNPRRRVVSINSVGTVGVSTNASISTNTSDIRGYGGRPRQRGVCWCGRVHYALGLCKAHYMREYMKRRRLEE